MSRRNKDGGLVPQWYTPSGDELIEKTITRLPYPDESSQHTVVIPYLCPPLAGTQFADMYYRQNSHKSKIDAWDMPPIIDVVWIKHRWVNPRNGDTRFTYKLHIISKRQ